MPIITLTTDWGNKDHYLGAVKGKLYSQNQDINIVDISHQITPFSIEQAAFIFKNCYQNFPEGSIHIIGVNTEESDKSPHVVIFHKGHYFIGADNGIFSMIFDEDPEKIIELEILQDSGYFTFSTRDRFVKAAIYLVNKKPIEKLGENRDYINVKIPFKPTISGNIIKGIVIYIDGYENLITNITEDLFKSVGKGRKYHVLLRGEKINKIYQSYNDVPVGEIVVIFGSNSHLEVAINQGNASSLLGISTNNSIMIEFEE
jgi:S-adenosylmethionine hydrolase